MIGIGYVIYIGINVTLYGLEGVNVYLGKWQKDNSFEWTERSV